jgi:multidrug efflux pump subunit AcrB
MNVSSWSIRNPTPAILAFIMLTLMGLMGFKAMKIQQFPDIDLPTVTVTASLPGASPAQMETEVARKLENSLANTQGLKHLYTKVQDGTVTITAEFRLEKGTQEAVDDVRAAVTRVRADLPRDLREPTVAKVELAGLPILTYTIASPSMSEEQLSWFVDNNVTKSLLSVRGVGAVARVGGVTRQVSVELDPAKLLALNATASEVSQQLRLIQQEASGGRSDISGMEQSVRTIATVQSAAEMAKIEVVLADGRHIRLDQVATVSDTIAERRSAALLNGRDVVGFEISRTRGYGEVDVAQGVTVVLEKLRSEHPDIEITEAFNFVDPVQLQVFGWCVAFEEDSVLSSVRLLQAFQLIVHLEETLRGPGTRHVCPWTKWPIRAERSSSSSSPWRPRSCTTRMIWSASCQSSIQGCRSSPPMASMRKRCRSPRAARMESTICSGVGMRVSSSRSSRSSGSLTRDL